MTLDTIVATIIAIFELVIIVCQWKERNRIKAKEEVWNKNIQSIVNITAKIQEKIDNKEIQDAKELKGRIEDISHYANGIHVSLKEELKIRD